MSQTPACARRFVVIAASFVVLTASAQEGGTASEQESGRPDELRGPDAFEHIGDTQSRSMALFEEAGKVITHPRCVNCHPATERPLQTDLGLPHEPAVQRGGDQGNGVTGMQCTTCHQSENVELGDRSIPGHPSWHVAPADMAWEGKSLGAICEQIKDPERNGGHDLAFIEDHMANDTLVGWAWRPGSGRTPVPGTQERFGALISAWIETGAHCPRGDHP